MIGAVVQARMGSTRLPGKVMLDGAGKPMLGHLLERLGYCAQLDTIIVATTLNPRDDVISDYCTSLKIPVFRGSEHDVLDRYFKAAKQHKLTCVVRVTSDCPLIDPDLIDETLSGFANRLDEYDLVTNRHPLTFVDGLDFDLIPFRALESAWQKASQPHQREHVVPFFWEKKLRVHNFEDSRELFYKHRWTLDYIEDYELIRSIYSALYKSCPRFTTAEILKFLHLHPQVSAINCSYLPHRK